MIVSSDPVIFIRPRLLGDIVMTIPTLLIFKRYFPHTPVFYALEQPFADLGALLPGVNELIVLPKKMTLSDHFTWRKKIKNAGIKTVIDLHCGPKSALLTRISGCQTRIGYKTKNRNWAYNKFPPSRGIGGPHIHTVPNQVFLLESMGIKEPSIPAYQLNCSLDSIHLPTEAADLMRNKSSPQLIIHIGSGNHFRYWGDLNYKTLLKKLSQAGVICHLIGHLNDERRRAQTWQTLDPQHIYNWVGRLSISQTLSLIHHGDCYFGPDSGPIHLASLTQTPIVGLYGPNIPAISGPWRKNAVTILEADLPCRPCSQRECRYDTIHCMEVIHVDTVLEQIFRYLR